MFSEASVILSTGGCMMSLHAWLPGPMFLPGVWWKGSKGSSEVKGQAPLVLTSSGGHCSGRYASYWNAFLLLDVLVLC